MQLKHRHSPNFDAAPRRTVDMLVLHYTGMQNAEEALARLCDPAARCQRPLPDRRGRHGLAPGGGGASAPGMPGCRRGAGAATSTARSIGIELVNPGHEFGYRAVPGSADGGAGCLGPRHPRAPSHPGAPCARPFRRGAGAQGGSGRAVRLAAPRPAPASACGPISARDRRRLGQRGRTERICSRLSAMPVPRLDVPDDSFAEVVRAFQLHFRPAHCDGAPDDETQRRAAIVARTA